MTFPPAITLLIVSALLLTACSPATFFSSLSRSQEEKGAAVQVTQADQVNQRLDSLQTKLIDYPLATLLSPLKADIQATAMVYVNPNPPPAQIEIDAYLTPPTNQYSLWFTNQTQDKFILIGNLIDSAETGRYQLTLKTDLDTTQFTAAIVSDELEPSTKPQNPVLAGQLISLTPTP